MNRKKDRLDYVDRVAMETCRDWHHLKLGFSSMMAGAEIGWQQGIDLFEVEKKRLSDFLELHGGWVLGSPLSKSICDGEWDWGNLTGGRNDASFTLTVSGELSSSSSSSSNSSSSSSSSGGEEPVVAGSSGWLMMLFSGWLIALSRRCYHGC